MTNLVISNPWRALRAFTDARIGLGRAGVSLPTNELLKFQLAHAQAQDAVHTALDTEFICQEIISCLPASASAPVIVHSRATDRQEYLCRPDLGRRLNEGSVNLLKNLNQTLAPCSEFDLSPYDLGIVVADGLSARAVTDNIKPMLAKLIRALTGQQPTFTLAPICIAQQGRVAIGDEIGEILHCKCVLLFIGERPGLSSPDSLGAYLTWAPKVGNTDAGRNCVSNIRLAGLSYDGALEKLMYLLSESKNRKLSGVQLKDRTESGDTLLTQDVLHSNFLLSEPLSNPK